MDGFMAGTIGVHAPRRSLVPTPEIMPIGKDEIVKMPDTILADLNASIGSPNFDTSYVAQRGDSISKILGTSKPAAIGAFMRINGLTSSEIFAGQEYVLPSDDYSRADSQLGQSALNSDNARRAIADLPFQSQGIPVCPMPAPPQYFDYGASRPTGGMRATTLWDRFLSSGVGQTLTGVADGSYALVRTPWTLSEGIGNLLSDGYGYAKDALVGPELSPLFGDELPYQAQSGLIRHFQQGGGVDLDAIALSLPVLAQFDAINRRDPYAFGYSVPSTALAFVGGARPSASVTAFETSIDDVIGAAGRGAGRPNMINPSNLLDNCTACVAANVTNKLMRNAPDELVTANMVEQQFGPTGRAMNLSEAQSISYIEKATGTTAVKTAIGAEGAPVGNYAVYAKTENGGHVLYGQVLKNRDYYFYDPQVGGRAMTLEQAKAAYNLTRSYYLRPPK
jgi:hypothetical protein